MLLTTEEVNTDDKDMMSRLAAGDDDDDDANLDPMEAAMRMIKNSVIDTDGIEANGDGEGDDGAEMDADAFSKMMAESLGAMGLNGGAGGEGGEMFNPEMMQKMMMQMMQEMMSREHLYDPIADLVARFPAWLEENKGKIDDETHDKHAKQFECYKKIIAAFDSDPVDDAAVQENMIMVQTFGPPPRDLVPEEHREALDQMMTEAPSSSQDDADALRAMLSGLGGAGGAGGDKGGDMPQCPTQ